MTEQKKLKIKIFDKEYSLLVENEARAQELGDYVNNMMNELRNDMSDQPTQTVAILASLNLANEMLGDREQMSKLLDNAINRVEKLNLLLEDISK